MSLVDIFLKRLQTSVSQGQTTYRKIWVDACIKPGVSTLCLTLFTKDNYSMRFIPVKNFVTKDENLADYVNLINTELNLA